MIFSDISNFDHCKVLVIGDLMLDEYVWGEVDRISPEAPVQVVSVQKEDYTLGGAGNVVNNLAVLGGKVSVCGVIGDAEYGDRLIRKFEELKVNITGIVRETGRVTTRKTRIIASHQHVLRIDRETKKEISAGTFERITSFIEENIPDMDVVLISDYGKGLLTNTLLKKIISVGRQHGKKILADPKGLDFLRYAGVSLLTPNKKEAAIASGIEITDDETLFKAGYNILQKSGIENLLITCGKDGMVLFEPDKSPLKIRAEARQVFDVSGAGDTVLSVIGLGIASGRSFEESAHLANTAAGIVVGKVGTATVSKEELVAALNPYADTLILKYKESEELFRLTKELKRKGKKIVLTNGCFDLLHAGHIMLFSASKKMGDILIVAIDDDELVKKIKGDGRPVISQKERIRILCALDSVDYVTIFSSSDDLTKLIKTIQPDVLTKGSNYTAENVFGHELVEQSGGRVVLFPVTENISTTDIINTIRSYAFGISAS